MMNYLLAIRVNYEKSVILKLFRSALAIRVSYEETVILKLFSPAFLSSYKKITLIFDLIRTAFCRVLIISLIRAAYS